MSSSVQYVDGIGECLIITELDDAGQANNRVIPLEAIASWRELLQCASDEEAVAAIIHVQDVGEPVRSSPDNAWTPAYLALAEREVIRATEQLAAHREGTARDPRSPRLRGMLAAHAVRDQVAQACRSTRSVLRVDERHPGVDQLARTAVKQVRPAAVTERRRRFTESLIELVLPD